MENPGLKRHIEVDLTTGIIRVYEPQFIKVTYRRVAAPPPMATPITDGTGYAGVPAEPPTLKENIQTPPPLTGGVSAPAVSATNGLPPLNLNPVRSQPEANMAANERRKAVQKQVGGGEKENPAYDRAQQQIRNKVQVRRAHPLHQGAYDPRTEEWLYDLDDPQYFEHDPAPSIEDRPRHMMTLKDDRSMNSGEMYEENAQSRARREELAREARQRFLAAQEPVECEGCGEVADPAGVKARFRQGDWESGFYHKPCFDWANREVIDDPESWQFGNDASRGHQFTSSRVAATTGDDEDDPRGEVENLISSLPEAGKAKTPEDRPWTLPTQQQEKALQDAGFEIHHEHMGEGWVPQKYWVRQDGLNDQYIAPSREEPRGGAWETSIGPRDHWAGGDTEEPVEPTFHTTFDNAFQRVTDPDTWYRENQADQDAEMWNRGKRQPGKMAPFKPSARPQNPGLVSLNSLRLVAETDDEFWARQPDVLNTRMYQPTGPDATGQEFLEDGSDPDWDDEESLEDVLPDNTSLAEHAHLLRNGFRWDDDERHPEYTALHDREIRNADGSRAYSKEGQVIGRNTHVMAPNLDESPEPLASPWTHTYYPAGQSDDEGLIAGHNTAQGAVRAAHQLSLWGARHPQSRELLKDYRYVGNGYPYDPSVELPHEAAQRMNHGTFRVSAFDPERGEFIYNIDTPNYHTRDKPPSSEGAASQQSFLQLKGRDEDDYDPPEDESGYVSPNSILFDAPYHHQSYEYCKGCFDRGINYGPDSPIHGEPTGRFGAHKYEPIGELPPGVRLAAEKL
jgi:hypothetical protein